MFVSDNNEIFYEKGEYPVEYILPMIHSDLGKNMVMFFGDLVNFGTRTLVLFNLFKKSPSFRWGSKF